MLKCVAMFFPKKVSSEMSEAAIDAARGMLPLSDEPERHLRAQFFPVRSSVAPTAKIGCIIASRTLSDQECAEVIGHIGLRHLVKGDPARPIPLELVDLPA